MRIRKQFRFEAAHQLPDKELYGKCRMLHGHSYLLVVEVNGILKKNEGWVMNFSELKHIVKSRIIDKLDHQFLNDIFPEMITTAENILQWIHGEITEGLEHHEFARIHRIELWETADSAAIIDISSL